MNATHAPPSSIPSGGDGDRGPPHFSPSPTTMTPTISSSTLSHLPVSTTEPGVALTTALNIHRTNNNHNQQQQQQQQKQHHDTAAISTSLALSPEDQAWLSEALNSTLLRHIDFDSITDKRMDVARGGYGTIHAGKWRSELVAVKVLHVPTDFIQEVKIHKRVGDCANVIKCWGVTWIESARVYGMVLQFATHGSLRDFLREHFDRLDWHRKIRLAKDVAQGLRFIHEEGVCHHDLHSRNVLVDQNKRALITDFGLSRNQPHDEMRQHSAGPRGVVPYISPERLSSTSFNHSSDIYSLGVIMWELSSGRPPFSTNNELPFMLAFHILRGLRETVVEGTPNEYASVYQRCWDKEPSVRPSLDEIIGTLERMLLVQRSYTTPNPQDSIVTMTNAKSPDGALGSSLPTPAGNSVNFITASSSFSSPMRTGDPLNDMPGLRPTESPPAAAVGGTNVSPPTERPQVGFTTNVSAPVQTSIEPLFTTRLPPLVSPPAHQQVNHHAKSSSSDGSAAKTHGSNSNSNSQHSAYSAYSNGSNNSANSYDLYLEERVKKMQVQDQQLQPPSSLPPLSLQQQQQQQQQEQQQHHQHHGESPRFAQAAVGPLKVFKVAPNPVIIPPLRPTKITGATISPSTHANNATASGTSTEIVAPAALIEEHNDLIEGKVEALGNRLNHALKADSMRPIWIQPPHKIPPRDSSVGQGTVAHTNQGQQHHHHHHHHQQQHQHQHPSQTSPKQQAASPNLQHQQLYQHQFMLQQQPVQQQQQQQLQQQHSPSLQHGQVHQGMAAAVNGHSGHVFPHHGHAPFPHHIPTLPTSTASPTASPRPVNLNLGSIGSPTMYPMHMPMPMPTPPTPSAAHPINNTHNAGGSLPTEMPIPHVLGKATSISAFRPVGGVYPPPVPPKPINTQHMAALGNAPPNGLASPINSFTPHHQHLTINTTTINNTPTSSVAGPGGNMPSVHAAAGHPSPLSGHVHVTLTGSVINKYIPRDGKATLQSFHRACQHGNVEAVQWHLFQGCDPMEPDREMSHRTALHRAVLNENHEVLKLLVESASAHHRIRIDERDDSLQTPLHILTHYGTDSKGFHKNLLYLLKRGANPNALDSERRTPLMTTMILTDNAQFVETLLDYGADPRIKCMNNNALAEAATMHRYECVKVLLDTELSMSEPESLSRAMDVCYNVRESEEGNKILALLVRCRDTPEGERKRRTLAWMILKGERFGERRLDQSELARKVVMVAENGGGGM